MSEWLPSPIRLNKGSTNGARVVETQLLDQAAADQGEGDGKAGSREDDQESEA